MLKIIIVFEKYHYKKNEKTYAFQSAQRAEQVFGQEPVRELDLD